MAHGKRFKQTGKVGNMMNGVGIEMHSALLVRVDIAFRMAMLTRGCMSAVGGHFGIAKGDHVPIDDIVWKRVKGGHELLVKKVLAVYAQRFHGNKYMNGRNGVGVVMYFCAGAASSDGIILLVQHCR
jgi:hypothetical protein